MANLGGDFRLNLPFWPLAFANNDKIQIIKTNIKGSSVIVVIDSFNRIYANAIHENKEYSFLSQPVSASVSGGYFSFKFRIENNKLVIWINDRKLLKSHVALGRVHFIQTEAGLGVLNKVFRLADPLPNLGGNDVENFFLKTLLDIQRKTYSEDPYELLKMSGLLRLMLLDNPCLIDLVNKKYTIKLEFNPIDQRLTTGIKGSTDIMPITQAVLLDKNIKQYIGAFSLYEPREYTIYRPSKNRNAFINVPCATVDGQIVSIKDVISYCANKAGGVHYDLSTPDKPSQQALALLDKAMQVGARSSLAAILRETGMLVLDGLIPLAQAITWFADA